MSANMGNISKVKRVSIPDLVSRKNRDPIVSLTAYTAPMARILDPHCDFLLVGDSLGMVLYGMNNTRDVTDQMMINHAKAVKKAAHKSLVFFDLPFQKNFDEKVNYLDKKVGNEGYVVDKQGNFLLTPEGQTKLQGKTMFGFSGVSPGLGTGGEGNLLAIDSDKFEGEDFADLIGEVGLPALGSIAGEVLAYRNLGGALPPQLRAITGMGLLLSVGGGAAGAYAGTLIDESQQWMRGISEEAKGDVQKRAAKEEK